MDRFEPVDSAIAGGLAQRAAARDGSSQYWMSVELVRAGALETIVADWRALQQAAVDDLPFMSPDFVLPAACHLAAGDGPDLVAIWERCDAERTLVGLVPLQKGVATLGDVWSRPRKATLWQHELQPFAAPLLAGPSDRASRAIDAFFGWLDRQPAVSSFTMGAMPSASVAADLLIQAATRRRLPLLRRRRPDSTRGLDFKPKGLQGAIDAIAIASEPAALRAALERLLCLDGRRAVNEPIILQDPMQPALLRTVVRSFGREGRAIIAESSEERAGALVLVGRDRGLSLADVRRGKRKPCDGGRAGPRLRASPRHAAGCGVGAAAGRRRLGIRDDGNARRRPDANCAADDGAVEVVDRLRVAGERRRQASRTDRM